MGTEKNGHRLEALSGFPESFVTFLKPQWIETAEEFLSVCSTPEGQESIQQLLQIDQKRFEELQKLLTNTVGEESAKQLTTPVPPKRMGFRLETEGKGKP